MLYITSFLHWEEKQTNKHKKTQTLSSSPSEIIKDSWISSGDGEKWKSWIAKEVVERSVSGSSQEFQGEDSSDRVQFQKRDASLGPGGRVLQNPGWKLHAEPINPVSSDSLKGITLKASFQKSQLDPANPMIRYKTKSLPSLVLKAHFCHWTRSFPHSKGYSSRSWLWEGRYFF